MKLKIFSDKSILPDDVEHFVMLYPFWGVKDRKSSIESPQYGLYNKYVETGKEFFELTSLLDADFAVLPVAWERIIRNEVVQDQSAQFIKMAQQAGKKILIFFWHDSTEEIPIDNCIIFRTSFYRTSRKPNEYAMPAWHEDIVDKYFEGRLPLRYRQDKPVIGFCGYKGSQPSILPNVRHILRQTVNFLTSKRTPNSPLKHLGYTVRNSAINYLKNSKDVITNFILRDRFHGAYQFSDPKKHWDLRHKLRHEYVQNIIESDYVLCARGEGNFSYRLYETLCCGRIPIFVDTDCVLPYDFEIDWKQYCVWIDQSELPYIAHKVAEFHNQLSPQEFITLQKTCRKLWLERLSPEGFFANFYRHFPSNAVQIAKETSKK